MPTAVTEEQLVEYLADVHSVEKQALTQIQRAPQLVEGELAAAFHQHLEETESQERRVRERLDAHGASLSKTKDLVGKAGGVGMVLFAYELLRRVAERAGDTETLEMTPPP